MQACERDRVDARDRLERERKFTVTWHRLSTNCFWKKEAGSPVVLLENSLQQYKETGNPPTQHGQVSLYGRHSPRPRPSSVWPNLGLSLLHVPAYPTLQNIGPHYHESCYPALQNLTLSYMASAIETDPKGTSLAIYFLSLFVHVFDRSLNWWHEIYIPLNSQRYQLRCMLLTKRVQLKDSHPLAIKWTSGRFNGLLRDVDELVNGV